MAGPPVTLDLRIFLRTPIRYWLRHGLNSIKQLHFQMARTYLILPKLPKLIRGQTSCHGAAGMCGSSMMSGTTGRRRAGFLTVDLHGSTYPCLISTLRNLLLLNPSTPAVSHSRWVSNVLDAYFLDRVLVWLTVDGNVLSRHTGYRSLRYKGLLPVRPIRMCIAIYTQPLPTSRSSSTFHLRPPEAPTRRASATLPPLGLSARQVRVQGHDSDASNVCT